MGKMRKKLENMKLNLKFTLTILIFVMIPMGVILGVLFYYIEQNTISEQRTYMENKMERNKSQMETGISSINMVTQFFVSDAGVLEMLNASVTGEEYSADSLRMTYQKDMAALERLVYNNPLLYGVRVYATNDNVLEMMPVLYQRSRMQKLSWAQNEDGTGITEADRLTGWHFGYYDTTFDAYKNDEDRLLCYVSKVEDYRNGTVGYVEAAMKMDTMFYEVESSDQDREWSSFVTNDASYYMGNIDSDYRKQFMQQIYKEYKGSDKTSISYRKEDGRCLLVAYQPMEELGGSLIAVEDITSDIHNVYRMRNITVAAMVVLLIGLSFIINKIVLHLLRKFYAILGTIKQVQDGDMEVRIAVDSSEEMGQLGTQLNTMLDRIQTLMQENMDRQLLVKNSQIRVLQNQINAHFIYNVLETIKMMAEIDEEYTISDAVTSLGMMLRYSMKTIDKSVMLSEELEYIRNYIALMNLRFDYTIFLSTRVPDEFMQQEIPKMSLQPIVENAIKHGIESIAEDTTIYIKVQKHDDDCIIEVTDSGKGMSSTEVQKLQSKIDGKLEVDSKTGHGIGLKNVQDRIGITFGEQYGLKVASKEGCFTKVSMTIPIRIRETQGKDV